MRGGEHRTESNVHKKNNIFLSPQLKRGHEGRGYNRRRNDLSLSSSCIWRVEREKEKEKEKENAGGQQDGASWQQGSRRRRSRHN